MLNDQSYYLTYTFKTANQSNQGNSLPGQVLFATNEVGYTESECGDGYNSNQNYTISGYGSYPQDFNPQVNQTQVVSYWVGSSFSYTVNWISPTTQSSTAPSAPQNLSAVTTPSSQIDLSWTAPSNNGGSAVTGYEVERSRGSLSFGGFSNSTNTTFFSTPNATAFADTGLSTSTTYNYTVFAKNSVGPSPHSNTASATTSTVTSPPTGLAATTVSSSQIHLSWTAPANNGGATITGYKIERSTDSGSTWSSLVANTGSTSTKYYDTGLTQNTSYVYRVSAINSAGASAPSNTSSATTP
ncbi:fibronectin type III domain-containing protein, partial [Candidatus Nitrosotalea sp. FS]|uniref:fibronectin type III domain-containing protein n=1 Tax=Candidatus Nitrosotalea sp. FS TaxID=2341021 RepID=UPI0037449657